MRNRYDVYLFLFLLRLSRKIGGSKRNLGRGGNLYYAEYTQYAGIPDRRIQDLNSEW